MLGAEEPGEFDPEVDEPWFWATPKGANINASAPKLRKRIAERMMYTFLSPRQQEEHATSGALGPVLLNPNQDMLLPGYLVLLSSAFGRKVHCFSNIWTVCKFRCHESTKVSRIWG